jgi:Beta-lactamase class C and other penicillin binding proteins
MKILIRLFSSLLIFSTSVNAQNVYNNLDSFFSVLVKNIQFNGNVLIVEKGRIVYEKSFGYADFSDNRLNTSNTRFPIASITKTFTATAILQLYEKGKLKINDPVEKYLPEFPYPTMKIRHLLSHTSGLQPYDNFFDSLRKEYPDTVFTNKDILSRYAALKLPLFYQPGDDCNYDNVNYVFLALIIEKVSGMTYHDYLGKYIFQPAGMKETFFPKVIFYNYANNEKENLANTYWYPHLYSGSLVKADTVQFISKYWHAYNFQGFGEIVSTTGDLLKFDQALTNGHLLKSETLAEAYTPVLLNNGSPNPGNRNNNAFGLGWIIENDSTYGKVVRASGGGIGLRSTLMRNISKQQTIILIDNTQNETDDIAKDVLKILNGKHIKPYGKSAAGEYGRVLVAQGIKAAKDMIEKLKTDSAHYSFNENEFNSLGYDLMGNQKLNEALETFRINTELFPHSWNVYDSYGEALLKNGQKDEALKMYKKSVELNPDNENGKKILKEQLK